MKTSQKIAPIAASIAIQLCLGTAYIWSVFQTGIANSIFAGDNAAASLSFSLLLATLSIGSVAGGKLTTKYPTGRIVMIGGFIMSAGFLLASFVTASVPWLLWLSYGVMGGVGMGFTYSTTIACAQKWFPEKKGAVTGLIVSALGFGGVIFTPIIEKLILAFGGSGQGEAMAFRILALIFFVICTVGSLFLKNPPVQAASPQLPEQALPAKATKSFTPAQALRDYRFYALAAALMLASMGGLMMIGFAKPIAVAKGMAATATIGVLVISLFNSMGRLFWGMVSDKVGRKPTIMLLLVGSALFSLLVNRSDGFFLYILIGFIGFFYGGFLSTFPSLTADIFGPEHMATIYGMVLFGFGSGAVISSYIAGYFKNLAVDDISLMSPAFMIAAASAGLALLLLLFLRTSPRNKA